MAEVYSSKNPYNSLIVEDILLNGEGATKETRHFVLELPPKGLEYKVGDALGVIPENQQSTVDALIEVAGWNSDEIVNSHKGERKLVDALKKDVEIHRLNKKFVNSIQDKISSQSIGIEARIIGRQRIAVGGEKTLEWFWSGESTDVPQSYSTSSVSSSNARISQICNDDKELEEYIWSRDYIDAFNEFELNYSAQEFLELVDKLKPRLYSIASSPNLHPGKVELTVAIVRYSYHGRERGGLCTVFMSDEVELGTTPVGIFMSPTKSFVIPADSSKDIIMIGPGTWIAPFRAFIEQREFNKASGRNWLFFGDQHEATEYYYKDQIEKWLNNGTLYRYTPAWSRDQKEKIYVQHRMLEYAEEVWKWIDNGAYFYVCGDKNYMAKDVHAALIKICSENGGLGDEAAKEFVEQTLMRTEKRYARDVY